MAGGGHHHGEDNRRSKEARQPIEHPVLRLLDATHSGSELWSQLPEDVRGGLEALKKHDKKIAAALKDPKRAQMFLTDPAATLEEIGVKMSPSVLKLLRKGGGPMQGAAVQLSNGQVVKPRINFRFTEVQD